MYKLLAGNFWGDNFRGKSENSNLKFRGFKFRNNNLLHAKNWLCVGVLELLLAGLALNCD